MNILIINAFGSSPKAIQRFESFCHIIKNTFKKISKGSGIESFNFICRSPNNISEFIYKHDMISGDVNQNKRNKKNFDKVDIVIIDGYEKYAPWNPRSNTLCEFIKLCKITNKILYAGGVGFEILVYYLSTGALNEYIFVNARGQIKSLEEMSNAPKKFLKELKHNDIFLDFVTGDIYEYKNDETWIPLKNIGMHNQISAEKYFQRGKFVLKDSFVGKDSVKNIYAISTAVDEIKVKITKHYFHHHLFENLPLEFIASTSMTWFPHFLNVLNQSLQYKILCECSKGPVVIEHNNSTGVIFHIMDKYQDSVLFLENFIKDKFKEIQNKIFKFKHLEEDYSQKHVKNEIPAIFKLYITSINYKKNTDVLENTKNTNLDKVTYSLAFSRIKNIKDEASHVGFGLNNRDMIFVENNYINQIPVVSTKKRKNFSFIKLEDEHYKLNVDKINSIFSSKTALRKNFAKFDKERNSLRSMKNFEYNNKLEKEIDNDNNKLRKRNLFLSYNRKILNKENNKKNSNLFLLDKNKSKPKYRLKSSKNSNRTINNESSKKKYDSNFDNNQELPNFSNSLKKNINNNNENSEDELDEIYVPKYPRPAILSGRNHEIKSPSYSMNFGYPEKNVNDFNNINFFELGLLNKRKFQTIIPKKSLV